MSKRWITPCIVLVALALLAVATARAGSPAQEPNTPTDGLATAFTYQGQLELDGQPVDSTCSFQFSLYDDAQGSIQIGATQTITGVEIAGGLFTVQLDFGATAFQGDARWLGIQVQCQGDAEYADLGTQALTATPYALYALGAPWGGISDMPAGFADGVDDVAVVVSGTTVYAGQGLNQIGSGDAVTLSLAPSYRLPQTCANGQITEWDGSEWLCGDDNAGEGDITAVYAGYGLDGGGETGDVSLSIVTDTIQSRVTDACGAGYAIRAINADGTVVCELVPDGDITAVYAGDGLNGGGISDEVTLTVAFSGTGTTTTAARSDHHHDHGELTGLDDDDHPQYFEVSQDETVTGVPAFVGGASGVGAPFSVDSDYLVADLNADLLDGYQASDFAPISHTHSGSSYQNVIVVAKSGGDFSSVQAALDSITDNGDGNRYLVWIGPGTYTERVTMKPYVDIVGAGEQLTKIT